MYDSTEYKILEHVYLKPGIHKRELSKQLKIGMPSIDHALKKINSLLLKKKAGNQIQYFLDYSKRSIAPALSVIEYSRFEKLPSKIKIALNDFLKELKQKPVLAVVFGSYAKNNYTESSDIDILLVFQSVENAKHIEDTAKKISLRTNTALNPVYITYEIFSSKFHNLSENFYKNLKKDKLILIGAEWWRQLEYEEA